jgi:uncharacterized protein
VNIINQSQKIFLFFVLFFWQCSSVFYHPESKTYFEPETFGLKKTETFLNTPDNQKIHTWLITPEQSKNRNVVIFQLHGNGENMSSHFISLAWLVNHGYELFTYDYRGYGQSTGDPSPKNVNMDTVLVFNHIVDYCKKHNKKLILYGQSLGGAISVRALEDVKSKEPLRLVILEGTFSSYSMVTRTMLKPKIFEPIPWIASKIVDNSYSPEEFFKKIAPIPTLIIHEQFDPVVPFDNGKEVFRLTAQPKQFWTVKSDGHIRWMEMGRNPNAKKFVELLNKMMEDREGYDPLDFF